LQRKLAEADDDDYMFEKPPKDGNAEDDSLFKGGTPDKSD